MNYRERRPAYVREHHEALGEVLGDMATHITSMWEARASVSFFDRDRWDPALRDSLLLRNRRTAVEFGRDTAAELDAGFNETAVDPFLISSAGLSATFINDTTEGQLRDALGQDEPDVAVRTVLAILVGSTLDRLAESTVTTSANFGMTTGAEQAGAREKTWLVNSRNPRPGHARMSGETAGMGENFSNGMQWPGDPAGGADENSNCMCSVDFGG